MEMYKKKILFFLTVFLGLENNLFAIDLGNHERAKIVQIATTDSLSPNLYQVSYPVEYEYWNASYPYNSMKYSGEVNTWTYTQDFSTYYSYGSWVKYYMSETNRPYTYVWVQMPSYTPTNKSLRRGAAGIEVVNPSGYPKYLGNNIWLYLDVNSNDVRSYEMVTQLNTSEGSADLYNNVYFNRFNH